MSAATKCDICQSYCKPEESKKLVIFAVSNTGYKAEQELFKEICPKCVEKVMRLINNVE